MVIIVVLIILVEVVRKVLIIIIDIVKLFGRGLKILVILVNNLFVIWLCFSMMFIIMNIIIVSSVLMDWFVRICLFMWFMMNEMLWFMVSFYFCGNIGVVYLGRFG